MGGAFTFLGYPCTVLQEKNNETILLENGPLSFYCGEKVDDHRKLWKTGVNIGQKFPAYCYSTCLIDQNHIYGNNVYSKDSLVCISALHAGVLNTKGGSFEIEIVEPSKRYESEFKKGVKS